MQVLIDNLDGKGSVDYTACIQFDKQATITRQLNKPSTYHFLFVEGTTGFPTPPQYARVYVIDTRGNALFTGHVASLPVTNAAGLGEAGFLYVATIVAVSDDVLLDAAQVIEQTMLLGQSAQQDWNALAALSSTSLPATLSSQQFAASSRLEVETGARWTETAEMLANSTRSAYRATAQGIQVTSLGEVVHMVAGDDPGLHFDTVSIADLHWLASDVTVCGREEPTAYVTEVFQGDGSTAIFSFSQKPFVPVARQRTSIEDLFQGTSLNRRTWAMIDTGAHVALTANGLTCAGGTGKDGESTVSSLQEIELGGALTFEGNGVQLAGLSSGILLGLYTGSIGFSNCFAGFQISSSTSAITIAPLVNGTVAGTSFTPQAGHLYTLRLRVFCPDMERVRQSYFYLQQSGPSSSGGQVVAGSGQLVFEIQDVTSGIAGMPIVLFSGAVSALPASCVWGLFSSGSLYCSMKSVRCTQSSPLWVTIGAGGNGPAAQLIATAPEGGTCRITAIGALEFYPASIPAPNALIYVNYRLKERAVARRVLPSLPSGSPIASTETWIGTVSAPVAWSRVDCDNAASALLGFATSTSVAVKGTYKNFNLQQIVDVWPGDALSIGPLPNGTSLSAIVRDVSITLTADAPDVSKYTVRFANDWAESVSIKLSSSVPADVVIPQQATIIASALQNPSGLVVTSVTTTAVSLNTGLAAPVNGGFEIRRRDNTFGPGVDSDLVLRTATSVISIPRAAAVEQYYVRMYDGAIPPNYSLFSAAVFLNVPI